MRNYHWIPLIVLAACGGSPNDTGTGTSTLLVDADVRAGTEVANASDPADFSTELSVRVSLNGADVRTGTVTVSSDAGSVDLTWNDNEGRWQGAQAGYERVYSLDVVSGDDNVRGVSLEGPDIHTFTAPDGTGAVDATQPLDVAWSRDSEADSATIETEEMDRLSIPDAGRFTIPVGGLKSNSGETTNERIRVTRSSTITPAGAVAGSQVRVSIENELPVVVAATGL